MTQQEFYEELKELARQKSVAVRLETGDFDGGYCLIDGNGVILINRRHPLARRTNVLARAIHGLGLDNLYVIPAVRDRIEDEIALRVDE